MRCCHARGVLGEVDVEQSSHRRMSPALVWLLSEKDQLEKKLLTNDASSDPAAMSLIKYYVELELIAGKLQSKTLSDVGSLTRLGHKMKFGLLRLVVGGLWNGWRE